MRRIFALVALAILAFTLPRGITRAQTTSPTIDPSQFVLTAADFPPPSETQVSQIESNAQAAADQRLVHLGTESWDDEKRITGYTMLGVQPNVDSSGAAHEVETYYLVSTFATPDDAMAAFAQQRDGWEYMVTDPTAQQTATVVDLGGQQFGDTQPRGLYTTTLPSTAGPLDFSELLFKRGPYLIEIFQALLHADTAAYGAQARQYVYSMAKKLDAIASGVPIASPTPVPPAAVDFSILKVRFEKNNQKGDLKAVKGIHKATAGTMVQMSIYFTVKSAPADAKVRDQFTLSQGGRTFHQKYSHPLGTTPYAYWWYGLYNVLLPRPGTYKFTGTITIGKVSKHGSATIKVTATHKVHASFRFDHPDAHVGAKSFLLPELYSAARFLTMNQ